MYLCLYLKNKKKVPMHQHKLDDDGLASSYLLLTAIIPLIVYLLYSFFKKTPVFYCKCKFCIQKKPEPKTKKFLLLFGIIPIVSILLKNIWTIKIKSAQIAFDPYKILNITMESTETEIKKSYRKLIRTFSKKLNVQATKQSAEEAIKNLNKAYSILKDPQSLDKFLNSTTTSELLIALPSFILNFNTPFLIFYIILIVLAVPLFFLAKHKNFKKTSITGSLYTSNEKFFEEFDNLSEIPAVILQQIFLLIGISQEFSQRKWLETIPKDMMSEENLKTPLVSNAEGYLRFILYLSRKLTNQEDKQFIASTALKLLEAFKKISVEKEGGKILKQLIIVEKMVHQGLIHPDLYLAQYPGVSFESALEKSNLEGGVGHNFKDDEANLLKLLRENDLPSALHIFDSIPAVVVNDLKAFTFQTQELDEAESLSSKNIKAVSKDGDTFIIPKDSAPNISFNLISEKYSAICHTPFTTATIPNKWYIFATTNGKILGGLINLDCFEGKKSIQLPLPFSNGKHCIKIHVFSNGYFGNDLLATLNIKYV